MGIQDEYGNPSPVPAEDDPLANRERYGDGLDEEHIREREDLLDVLAAEKEWGMQEKPFDSDTTLDRRYEEAVDLVSGMDYSKETIRDYCLQKTWCDEDPGIVRNGLFLSALINEHDGEEYVLPDLSVELDSGWREGLSNVGYRNRKDITVQGSMGGRAGLKMQDGTLVVEGDIYGDAGQDMQGGTFRIHGDVARAVGGGMEGGTIELHGDASLAPERDGGSIYRVRNGEKRQVWPIPDLDLPYQDEVEAVWEACRAWRQDDKDSYRKAVKAVEPLEYSTDAVYAFAEHGLEHAHDGHFLTALMAEHSEQSFRLPSLPDTEFVGMDRVESLVIEGDVGDFAGSEMTGGVLTVQGHAGDFAGYAMEGGRIVVQGDAGDNVGEGMEDGRIEVYGDAGEALGEGMDDGLIRVHGTVAGHETLTWDGRIEQVQGGAWVELSEGFPEGYDDDGAADDDAA